MQNLMSPFQLINMDLMNSGLASIGEFLSKISGKILVAVIMSIIFLLIRWIGIKIINHLFKNYKNKHEKEINSPSSQVSLNNINTFNSITDQTLTVIIIILWINSLLSLMGISLGPIIAGAGIFSLAIAYGAQGFINDVINGTFLLLEKQMAKGDIVKLGNVEGKVSNVTLRVTEVTSLNGATNYIPNRYIKTVTNLSKNKMVAIIDIKINNESPIRKIEDTIKEVNKHLTPKYPEVLKNPDVFGTVELPNGDLAIRVYIVTKNGTEQKIKSIFLTAYLEALDKYLPHKKSDK